MKFTKLTTITTMAAFAIALNLNAADKPADAKPAKPAEAKAKAALPPLANANCPVSGKPINGKDFIAYSDEKAGVSARIYTCCPNCPKSASDDAKKKALYEKAFGKEAKEIKNKNCPASGKPVDGKTMTHYNGASIGLCCPDCAKEVASNPDKTLGSIKADIDAASKAAKPAEAKK